MLFIRLKNLYFTQFLYTTFYLTNIYNLEYDLLMDKKNNKGKKMRIKVKQDNNPLGIQFKVWVNGVKYPKEKGLFYIPQMSGLNDKQLKQLAIKWAMKEAEGKAL